MSKDAAHKTDKLHGLARLRAESRRFQDELRCISSSLCCPHPHQGHGHGYGDPSSSSSVVADDQSSDNSVWDSPHTLRQIVTSARTLPGSVSFSHASVQAGTGDGGNGNGQDSEQEATPCPRPYCEYSVDSPVSVQQANAGTALEYDSGQEKAVEITRRDGSTCMQSRADDELSAPAGIRKEACGRITATTIFTANGGRLVLRSPSPSILQGSITPSGEVAIESAWSQDTRPQGNAVEWKRSTTLTMRNDSNHVCTGSVMICEENTSARTKDASVSTSTCSPDEPAIKDPNQRNDSNGIPIYHTQISLENFTRKANVDESDSNKLPRPGPSTKLMKLKNATASVGKDNVLARRMATRIKFMLQTLDSNKQTGHDQLCYRTFNQGINLKKYHDPAHRLRQSENLAQNRISKVEGIPDPESYLEDVVLALSSSAYASHADDFHQGEKLTIDGGDQEVIHKVQPQPAKLDSPPESSMEKGKGENTDPNGMRGYVSGTQPGKLLEYSTDSSKPQEILAQHSRSSDTAGEAVEYRVETGSNQMFAKNDAGNVIANQSIIDNPNTAFLQDCRKKVCHLLEGNLLLEKQRRMAGALHKVEGNIANEQEFQTLQSTFHERMGTDGDGLNMTEHLETKVPSSQGINLLDGHVSLTMKPDSGDSEKQLISTVRRDSQLKIKSPRSSVLDSAVDAAIHAANDLAKNLAHGITSDVATTRAEQVTDSQLQRTKSATKAVQVLLGEKFDYGSMYQDLKMLEVERRKLEGRAKTTVQFQTNSTAAGRLLKQDKLYDQQLLRRKAEAGDGSLSVSDAKRRRTTKSPNHGCVPRSTGWKHERTEMKQVFPTYMSSFGISMANHWNEGGEHRFPMTMVNESKRKSGHARIQTQVKTKVRVQRPKGSYQGPQNIDVKEKSTTPPDWAERMTRGRPSHDIHEFQIKDAIGTSATKNFVVRRSVRPPGSIFKTSNLIQWTSKTTCIQDAKPQKRNKGKLKRPEDIKAQPKVPNKPAFEMGSSSKSLQNLNVFDESEKITENKGNTNNAIITFSEEKKEESKKPRTEMITEVQSPDNDVLGNYENVPKDLDAKKSFVESLLRDIAEQSRKKLSKNENTQQEELAVSGMLTEKITDESVPAENADDYRRQFEERTQGSLLAMALQSILNDQSSDDNESRGLIRPKDLDPNNCKDLDPAQQCKSVQTTEINSAAPASVYAPFPLLPAYHLPDGNTHPTPPLFYIPCTPGNFPCTTSEQVNLSTTRSHRHGKKPLSSRNTHKYSDCSRYVSVKQQESSSSVTTPSSPASIYEVEDLCETGWNHPNEAVLPFKTDTNHQDMEKSNKEEESLEKCVGSRNDEIIENNKREPVVPELRRHQGGRVSGEEELQITRRSPFTPSGDRINSSVQNWVKETVSRLEIPFTTLVSRQKVSAPSYSSIIVPSWAEIKRPMRGSSSSQNSSSNTDELSSFSTNSSFSIGELQQKAFAILRDSVSTSLVSLGEVGNTAQVQCDDISEGEVDTVDQADDLVELGEVMLERLPIQVADSASSEGALKFELGEIVS